MKKVTILLPAYNEEDSFPVLEQCMKRVLDENPGYEWEFLMVNDGSTDHTLQQMAHGAGPAGEARPLELYRLVAQLWEGTGDDGGV